ncbi:hypothetical protein SB5439_05110 [Klebsiella variicola]|uniref:hypothetical protein n=1 Tax=Klebsiella variicola TaxID=244366 RepID=UPI00109C6FFA|nr:hypothetical protein [Klebsiella variicola]VGQ12882.1 hypothetical protein SB5439_05110 [Klebsiella variicola]
MKPSNPYLSKSFQRVLARPSTDDDIIFDTIEVTNTITQILIGALIEPGRNAEQWTRARIRECLASKALKRARTVDLLMHAQRKDSAFESLRHTWNKLQLTRAPDGGHLHDGRIVDVDYSAAIIPNI